MRPLPCPLPYAGSKARASTAAPIVAALRAVAGPGPVRVAVPFAGTGALAVRLQEAGFRVSYLGEAGDIPGRVLRALRDQPGFAADAARALAALPRDLDAQRAWYLNARDVYNAAPDQVGPVGLVCLWLGGYNGLVRYSHGGRYNTPHGKAADGGARQPWCTATAETLGAWGDALRRMPPCRLEDYHRAPQPGDYGHAAAAYDPPYFGGFDAYVPGGFDHRAWSRHLAFTPGPWVACNSAAFAGPDGPGHLLATVPGIARADAPERPGCISSDGAGRARVAEGLLCRRAPLGSRASGRQNRSPW